MHGSVFSEWRRKMLTKTRRDNQRYFKNRFYTKLKNKIDKGKKYFMK